MLNSLIESSNIIVRYDEANYFLNIPKDNEGGISLIIKEEVLTPSEWRDKYEAYLEMKKANKNKTSYQVIILYI